MREERSSRKGKEGGLFLREKKEGYKKPRARKIYAIKERNEPREKK